MTYEVLWRNAHALYDMQPERFDTVHLIAVLRPKEIYSLWKRLLDPYGAAKMPFPADLLSEDQITTDLTEQEFNVLYAWFRSCPKTEWFDPNVAAEFVEEHSVRPHFS